MNVEKKLDQAVASHQAGRLSEAEKLYQQVLAENPQNADALHLLGVIAYQVNKHGLAINLITSSIEIAPQQAEAYNNLGIAFKELGELGKSIQTHKKAIEINPDHAEAYYNLGNTYQDLGELEESVQTYQKAIEIKPDYAEACNNLGIAFKELGELEKSIQAYQKAIEIKPNYVEVYNNLGNVYQEQRELELAVQHYLKAIEMQPTHTVAHNNLGNVYQEQGELELAVQHYLKAIEMQPQSAETHNNLANAYQEQRELELAVQNYLKAVDMEPNFAEAHNNLGQILLLLGDFRRGWLECEWRWKCRKFSAGKRPFPQPVWAGGNLRGKSILVWTEQGIGDEIMFANLLNDFKRVDTDIIVECEKRLVPFFQRSFPGILFLARENPPNSRLFSSEINYQISIGSLGQWLRPNEESFNQNKHPYLTTCADKSEQIRERYQQLASGNMLIGISWKSAGIKERKTLSKSTILKDWFPILSQQNCYFINLQYGDIKPELENFQSETGLRIHHDHEIDSLRNLDDFGAQVSALDLVISTSNTTVHIAGALGKRTWALLPYMPDWRWMLNRKKSLWYPRTTLFRQNTIGNWSDVFQQVGSELEQYVANDEKEVKL